MIHGERPPRTYRTGTATRALRLATLVAAAAITVFLLVRYPSLPETIPTHFGLTGEADAWGPRSTILLPMALFTGLAVVMAWLSGRPQVFNYPIVITDANAQSVYREGERLMVWVAAGLALLYAGTAVASLGGGGGGVLIAAGLLWVVGALIVGLIRTASASRRPSETADEQPAHPED